MRELTHIQDTLQQLERHKAEAGRLPSATEQVRNHTRATAFALHSSRYSRMYTRIKGSFIYL